MEDKMKTALLTVCEKYAGKNVDVNVDFAYELFVAAVGASETKIDDMLLPAILATKDFVKDILKQLADKIDGVIDNIEE